MLLLPLLVRICNPDVVSGGFIIRIDQKQKGLQIPRINGIGFVIRSSGFLVSLICCRKTESMDSHIPDRSGAPAVKTPGRGFVLTRFLLPFHRLEKEEPVRLEDTKKR